MASDVSFVIEGDGTMTDRDAASDHSPKIERENEVFDAIVVGAGVAGALSALLAARNGRRVLLADRQKFPRSKVCGCCLNGRAQEVLKAAGLENGLAKLNPIKTSGMRVHQSRKSLSVPMPGGLAVSRFAFDQWLVTEAVAAGATFLEDTTATVVPLADIPSDQCVSDVRSVELECSGRRHLVHAKMVLVCDGLSHPSLSRLKGFESIPRKGARIGLGAMFPRGAGDTWIPADEIQMVVGTEGYAGVVEVEGGQLNLAAAVRPSALQARRTPLQVLTSLFESNGLPVPSGLPLAVIRGTVPLTRKSRRISEERLFVLGDATGYVEPFTGEGMAWAMTAAMIASPLAEECLRNGWTSTLEDRFLQTFEQVIIREQGICRLMSTVVGNPLLLKMTMSTFRLMPWAARSLVARVNRLPSSLKRRE